MTQQELDQIIAAAYAEFNAVHTKAQQEYQNAIAGTQDNWPMGQSAPVPEVTRQAKIRADAMLQMLRVINPAFAECQRKIAQAQQQYAKVNQA